MSINKHIIYHTPLFLQNSIFVKFLYVLLYPVEKLHMQKQLVIKRGTVPKLVHSVRY